MKTLAKITALALLILSSSVAFAQYEKDRSLQQFRYPDQRGINAFEALEDTTEFDGVKVRLGGAFAVQFQALDHENGGLLQITDRGDNLLADSVGLLPLTNSFNLPTANLDLNVALADGVRMHMRTYLSSRHHPESWVKGGYVQISKLDFIQEGFLEGLMDITTVKIGLMELNYGDYHFRRSDNALAIYNPFVGNLILDGFNTEVGAEVYFTPGDFLIMAGLTNGNLNQNVIDGGVINDVDDTPAFLAKLGYDKQFNDDFRARLTTSLYTTAEGQTNYLYFGDRAGSRYYSVMDPELFLSRRGILTEGNPTDQFTSGRFNPGFFNEVTAIMINPFVKFGGLEFLGTAEFTSGRGSFEAESRNWTQLHGELLYRFGEAEDVYIGAKYNTASGELSNGVDVGINRLAFAAGWYMTKNMMVKGEYVVQNYEDFAVGSQYNEGSFNGAVLEAVISF